jgi:nitroreductase
VQARRAPEAGMSFAELAHARRTHKAFGPEPIPREALLELLELAALAPTHHMTQPWRFRILGSEALAALKEASGEKEAPKLDRAPTLVVVSAALSGDLVQDEEDVCATAAAVQLVLLAATDRGFASYWRTPGVLRTRAGRSALGIPHGERVLGLLHFGYPVREPSPREREPVGSYVHFLP